MTLEEIEKRLTLAKKAIESDKFQEAEIHSQTIIDNVIFTSETTNSVLMAYRILTDSYIRRGMYKQAITPAEKSLKLSVQYGSRENEAQLLNLLGLIHLDFLDQSDSALQYFNTSKQIFDELGQQQCSAICLHNISNIHFKLANYSLAIQKLNEVLTIFKESNNNKLIAQTCNNIAVNHHCQSEYHDAIDWYLKSLSLYTELNLKSELAITLANLGSAYRDISDFENAMYNYHKALPILDECGMRHALAQCYGNIGVTYRNISDYKTALRYLGKSLAMYEELSMQSGIAMFAGNIGITYSQMGDHVQSLRYLESAYEIYKQLDQKVETALFATNIGYEYYLLREYELALQYSNDCLPILKKFRRHEEATGTYRTIGLVYSSLDFDGYDFNKAEKILLEVIASYSQLDAKFYLYQTHQHLATLYKQEQRWEEYAEHIEKYHQLSIEVQNEEVKKQADRFGWERKVIEMEKEKEIEKIKTDADKRLLEETINSQKLSIEQQSRELKNTIEELVRKNSLLQHIQSDIKKIAPHTIREGTEHIKQLLDRVERNITPLESNQHLRNQLNDVHKDLMSNLHAKFPEITIMELKIAALLSMKLTSSNIAAALYLSKRTVESHRLSLRKKIGLGKDDDIYTELVKYLK